MASNKGSSGGRRGKLAEYRRKRDFQKTAEPAGEQRARGESGGQRPASGLQFVVQKHAASHLHYDLRLELDGVMKSWAVPKGPSYDPGVRRLAMQVEDHPIEYNTFEGTIPKGEYGGGTVMLWDRGTYDAENGGGEGALRDGYERGDLGFVLHGDRLKGGWVLVRMKPRAGDSGSARAQWLLIKHRDETARPGSDIAAEVTTSVATGRTMDEIAAGARPRRKRSAATRQGTSRSATPGVRRRETSAPASRGKPSSPRRHRTTRSRS